MLGSTVIIIFGKSGSGKSTLITSLVKKYPIEKIVSYCTREKRVGEVSGRDYYFVNSKQFSEVDFSVTHIISDKLKYGISSLTINKIKHNKNKQYYIFDGISPLYIEKIIEVLLTNKINYKLITLVTDNDVRFNRMLERGDDAKDIAIRISREDLEGNCSHIKGNINIDSNKDESFVLKDAEKYLM